jgi:hypothetical protein
MDILSTYYFNIEKHISIHNSSLLPNSEQQLKLFFDPSCPLCYPNSYSPDLSFYNFWNWFATKFSAITYTSYTREHFYEFMTSSTYNTQNQILEQLILTIRFANPPLDLEEIIFAIQYICIWSNDFTDSTILYSEIPTNLIPHSSNLNSSNREGKMLIQIEKLLILRPTKDRLWKALSLVDDLIYLSCDISTELRNLKSKILNSLDEHYL